MPQCALSQDHFAALFKWYPSEGLVDCLLTFVMPGFLKTRIEAAQSPDPGLDPAVSSAIAFTCNLFLRSSLVRLDTDKFRHALEKMKLAELGSVGIQLETMLGELFFQYRR